MWYSRCDMLQICVGSLQRGQEVIDEKCSSPSVAVGATEG